jgi:ubiquitin-like modifier-activating enzyme ATG7
MADATTPLMFEPPCSAPDGGFWREAARVKLHEAKLDETPIDVRARVCCAQNAEVSSAVSLDALAFDDATSEGEEAAGGRGTWTTRGRLTCANTREALATFDRDGAMRAMGREMLESVMNGDAEREPERLRAFAVVAYACLKSWSFTYWFAFPALASAEF